MIESDCYVLGQITKPHGYNGEVIFFIDADDPSAYQSLDAIWLKIDDRLVPHFIDSIKPHNTAQKFVVTLDGIDSEAKAKSISGCTAFAPLTLLPELDDKEFYLHEVAGWEVLNLVDQSLVGTVQKVLDYAIYPILEVQTGTKEVLIPLPKDVEIKVDRSNQRLLVDLPEGLLEVYLGDENTSQENGPEWDGE